MPVVSAVNFSCPVSIKECIIPQDGCCCLVGKKKKKKNKSSDAAGTEPAPHVFEDSTLNITLINSAHIHLDSLGDAQSDTDSWDFMMVDKDLLMIMFTGRRFTRFARTVLGSDADVSADACRGKTVEAVFGLSASNIMTPLLKVVLGGIEGQLHTIHQNIALTMFAFPVIDTHSKQVLGAHIIYRPSRFNATDIAALITTQDSAAAAAAASDR